MTDSLPPIAQKVADSGPHTTRLVLMARPGASFKPDACLERLNLKFSFDSTRRLGSNADLGLPPEAWYRILRVQDYPFDMIVWSESGPLPAERQPRPTPLHRLTMGETALSDLAACDQRLCLETMLDPARTQLAYGFVLKVAALLGGEDLTGMHDVASGRFFPIAELHELTRSAAPPPIHDLVALEDRSLPGMPTSPEGHPLGPWMLCSRGMLRAVQPEVALPLVNMEHRPYVARLLHAVAASMASEGVPTLGQPFELMGLPPALVALDLAEAIPPLAPHIPPTLMLVLAGDANAPLEHAARRLGEALENLQIEHLTPYEAHIRQTVARERLPRLIEVFARAEGTALEFSYKAGVRMDGAASISSAPGASDQAATLPPAATPEEALRAAARAAEVAAMHPSADDPAAPADADRQPREFLWFRLLDATAEGLHGELVSTPNHIENLVPGDARYHAPADVADWLIRLEDGTTFGPGDVTLLNYVASRLKA